MRTVNLLDNIRPIWIERVSRKLARGESVRESFINQLREYLDTIEQAIITGDPSWMDKVLNNWVEARTISEIENQDVSLAPLLGQIMIVTHEVASEFLGDDDAMALLGVILPLYIYSIQYTTSLETRLHVEHISKQLDDARMTLEQLDKSKSDFISVAAHELKTPLTLIEGYTAMLRDQIPGNDYNSTIALLIKGVDNGAARLREIIDDMVDVSLLDNNMLMMNYQPIWIGQLISIIRRELEGALQDRQQHLEIVNFKGIDELIYGDSERLYQALRNLLTNAIKFTPDNGKITIDGRILPGFIEITISDTGIGVDVKDQERIFEKFGRVGNVSLHSSGKIKFKGGGPGLGLPTTKGIIEAHGGTIWVESDGYDEVEFPGTTFHVLLPIRKESPDEHVAEIFRPLFEAGLNPPILDSMIKKEKSTRIHRRESW